MNIIDTTPVYINTPHFQFDLFGLFFGILAIAALVVLIYYLIKNNLVSVLIAILVALLAYGSYSRFFLLHATKEIHHNEYVVQVDEQITAKKFNEKYEILERIGEGVYLVNER